MTRQIAYPGTRANPTVTAVCVDCGTDFEKSTFAAGKVRCDECQLQRNRWKEAESKATRQGRPAVERDRYDCKPGKCKHYKACKAAIKADKGCARPCFEGDSIPVIGWDVTSEFDGISITASVWSEQR